MLEKQIKGFIVYCKVAGFHERSIETVSSRLNEFRKLLKLKRLSRIRSISYAHRSAVVADPFTYISKRAIDMITSFPVRL